MKKKNIKYTYLKGRKCEHCGEPIADHLHESRKYCLPVNYEDGIIKDCKVDHNNEKAGAKIKEIKAILYGQKELFERVKKLVALKGTVVTPEDLDFHLISLKNALRHEHNRNMVISYFPDFEVTTYINEGKHLIKLKQ